MSARVEFITFLGTAKKERRRTSSVNYVARTTRLLLMMGHVTRISVTRVVCQRKLLHLATLRWRKRVSLYYLLRAAGRHLRRW
jgi:hypothetical protein